MVNEQSRLQNAADAAVLAAGQVLLRQQADGAGEVAARDAAAFEADELAKANCPKAGVEIEFGRRGSSGAFEPVDSSTAATAVRARTFRDTDAPGGPVALHFAPLLGVKKFRPSATAAAEVAISVSAVRQQILPFGIPYQEGLGEKDSLVFYPCDGDTYNDIADASTVPGCFGLLNLDGGDLSTTEIADWIASAYPGEVALDPVTNSTQIQGTSGVRASIQKVMKDRLGDPIIIMVYDAAYEQGANAIFNCIGFIAGTVTGCRLTGANPYIEFTVQELALYHNITAGVGAPSVNIRKVQLFQ